MRRKERNRFLDKRLRGWLVKTADKNLWRMPSHVGLDDLVQDGFIAYAITKQRYGHRVENKRHFMALFQRVFMSIIHNAARKRSKSIFEISAHEVVRDDDEDNELIFSAGVIDSEGEFNATAAKASEEVKLLLDAINNGKLSLPRVDKPMHRETYQHFLNRIAGTEDVDFKKQVHALLFPEQSNPDFMEELFGNGRSWEVSLKRIMQSVLIEMGVAVNA